MFELLALSFEFWAVVLRAQGGVPRGSAVVYDMADEREKRARKRERVDRAMQLM